MPDPARISGARDWTPVESTLTSQCLDAADPAYARPNLLDIAPKVNRHRIEMHVASEKSVNITSDMLKCLKAIKSFELNGFSFPGKFRSQSARKRNRLHFCNTIG
jgi:hypothetical protein